MSDFKLIDGDATIPPDGVEDIQLIWTHLPVGDYSYLLFKLTNWTERMNAFGTIIVCRYDFADEQELFQYVETDIIQYTDVNNLVVDPFCGSSTTGVAALQNHRRYVGIDVSNAALATSRKNLSDYANR